MYKKLLFGLLIIVTTMISVSANTIVQHNSSGVKPATYADDMMFNKALKDCFLNSKAQESCINDLRKAYPERFSGFVAIERAEENPTWKATADKYGDAVAKRQQAIAFSYAKPKGFFSKAGHAYNAQRYGLRAESAQKELSKAMESGDELKISEARNKYQNELKNQYLRGYAYDNATANRFMRFLAHIVPILVGIFIIVLLYVFLRVIKRVCNPELWEQSKNSAKQGKNME